LKDTWLKETWLKDTWLKDTWLKDTWLKDTWLKDIWLKDTWLKDNWLKEIWLKDRSCLVRSPRQWLAMFLVGFTLQDKRSDNLLRNIIGLFQLLKKCF
jgi:hypothetical protein